MTIDPNKCGTRLRNTIDNLKKQISKSDHQKTITALNNQIAAYEEAIAIIYDEADKQQTIKEKYQQECI